MSVIVEEYWKHCPRCGAKMIHVQKPCGCEWWECPECGYILRVKTCRRHLAEMLKGGFHA